MSPSEPTSLPDDVLRRLAALPEGEIRDRAALRFLSALPAEAAAQVIDHALRRLRVGTDEELAGGAAVLEAVVLGAGGSDLAALGYEQRSELYRAARAQGLLAAALFLSPPPQRAAPLPQAGLETALSLGHRRSLARVCAPESFPRLGAEKDVRVLRELLRNPRLTEREVLRLASARPAQPEVLLALARSERFAQRLSVRTAIARNPYSPPPLALRLLPHLPGDLLADIAADGTLHPEVKQFAAALLLGTS